MKEAKEVKLPSTRREQIFYSLRYYFSNISFASYITFFFAIPLIIYVFFFCYQWVALLHDENATEMALMLFGSVYGLPIIPFTGLIGVGLSGAFTMMMRMTSDQPMNNQSYVGGIKENGLRFFALYALLGFLAYIAIFNFFFFEQKETQFIFVLMRFFSIVLFLFGLIMITCASALQVKYKMSFKDVLKTAVVLSFKKMIISLLVILLTIAPLSLLFFFSRVVKVVILAVLFLFYFGIASLVLVEWYQYIFDEAIHRENKIEEYHRGLSSYRGNEK